MAFWLTSDQWNISSEPPQWAGSNSHRCSAYSSNTVCCLFTVKYQTKSVHSECVVGFPSGTKAQNRFDSEQTLDSPPQLKNGRSWRSDPLRLGKHERWLQNRQSAQFFVWVITDLMKCKHSSSLQDVTERQRFVRFWGRLWTEEAERLQPEAERRNTASFQLHIYKVKDIKVKRKDKLLRFYWHAGKPKA